jgi:hypothetical protein
MQAIQRLSNWVVNRLAGTALTIADIIRSRSMTLDISFIDPGHTNEVLDAFGAACQAFVDACGAGQAATEALRNYTQRPQ